MTWIVGLTGGIGSGKTQASNAFASLGVPVIDTDVISHALTAPGGLAIADIREAFGDELIDATGAMDRTKMRELVFHDAAAREKLESIIHPWIQRVTMMSLDQYAHAPYVVLVVPLLAESPFWASKCDRILVIDCDVKTQVDRVTKRSNLSEEQALAIINTQVLRDDRKAIANEVIVNESTIEHLTAQVRQLHEYYLTLAQQSQAAKGV